MGWWGVASLWLMMGGLTVKGLIAKRSRCDFVDDSGGKDGGTVESVISVCIGDFAPSIILFRGYYNVYCQPNCHPHKLYKIYTNFFPLSWFGFVWLAQLLASSPLQLFYYSLDVWLTVCLWWQGERLAL